MDSFMTPEEMNTVGFSSIGNNVLISKKVSIYGASKISIGSNVRIDDFCILSGKITIGNCVHISAYTGMFAGDAGIVVEDYATISSRNCIYAINDDYSGLFMTNPMVDEKYRNVTQKKVTIGKYSIIGSGCTCLPGVTIGEGAAIGAMSLIKRDIDAWSMNVGIPCHKYDNREKNILNFVKDMNSNG